MPKFKVINTHIKMDGKLLAPGDVVELTGAELKVCPNILKNLEPVVKAVEVPKEETVVEEPAPAKKTVKKKKKKKR